ncbi:MAG: hypothetical protein QOE97_1266 [Pseudonocardiales bacterium]|jgi:hypothetical protein|nr:hypothetical protein [Pseudonocardiales bacterium]
MSTHTDLIPDALSVELAYRRALLGRDAESARAAKRYRALRAPRRTRTVNSAYGRHPSGGA